MTSPAAQPGLKPIELHDSRLSGFILRIQPSGARSYIAQLGRGRRVTIGKAGHLTPDVARERCEKILGNVAHGREPLFGIGSAGPDTLGSFIAETYEPWAKANRPRSADRTLEHLKSCFAHWYMLPLDLITVAKIESWKLERFKQGRKPSTVLRNLGALSGVLTRAVRLGKLADNSIRRVDKPRIDRSPKVRYLDQAEEKRLRASLMARDEEMRRARASANQWRADRTYDLLPTLPHYGDHVTPAVLLSMNTGLRRGELLALSWSSIDFKQKLLTVEGHTAKAGQTRHIPLNAEALETMKRWHKQCMDNERVFPIETSFKTSWATLLKRAKIINFRWHDLRHHFASRLAQAGVPLNTIRELLGHGSLAMTLRYAHLAPDQKRDAVAKLMPL